MPPPCQPGTQNSTKMKFIGVVWAGLACWLLVLVVVSGGGPPEEEVQAVLQCDHGAM